MRRIGVLVGLVLVLVLVVGIVDYQFGWPFGLFQTTEAPFGGPQAARTDGSYVPRYSNVRGLQDAPRDDVAQGGTIDMQHCLNTMNLRGLKQDEAQHTCRAIVDGIYR